MPNPSIKPSSGGATPAAPAANGILTQIGADYISAGIDRLPPPCEEEMHQPDRAVELEVPHFGLVRICYELGSYKHGRNRRWHWRIVRADEVESG